MMPKTMFGIAGTVLPIVNIITKIVLYTSTLPANERVFCSV